MSLTQKRCILGLWLLQNTTRKPNPMQEVLPAAQRVETGRSISFRRHRGDTLLRLGDSCGFAEGLN